MERKKQLILVFFCAVLFLLTIPFGRGDQPTGFELEKSNHAAKLVFVSEEELLADTFQNQQVAAFSGTVKAIHNLKGSSPNGHDDWSIVDIEITEDFRTDLTPGTIVSVKMPGQILEHGGSNSIMDTAGMLKVGYSVIIMPTPYLIETADYALKDGSRWLFVETPAGLVYSESSYPSFAEVETLEDVAEILQNY